MANASRFNLLVVCASAFTVAAGLSPAQMTPYGTVLRIWMRACTAHAPACQQGALARKPYSVGLATTDATGHAQTPPLPPGRYRVLSDAKVANKDFMWHQPVDVGTGEKLVTLDERNAMPVD